MTDEIQKRRENVVAEVKSWLRTPYHPEGRIKGAGVDCAMLVAEVYQATGEVPRIDPEHYPPDWHLHRGQERYLEWVLKYATEIPVPGGPGDLVLFKFGRCFSHGAIIVKWPQIIHAYLGRPVCYEDVQQCQFLKTMGEAGNRPRPMRFFTLWPTEAQKRATGPAAPHGEAIKGVP